MANASKALKSKILDYYYTSVYQEYLFSNSLQSKGINYFEKQLERVWQNTKLKIANTLEIGSGQGEHLPYVKSFPSEGYYCLDIREVNADRIKAKVTPELAAVLNFVKADAEAIPFAGNFFDRVLSTCLLHHVDDPLQVLLEMRRVTNLNGEIAIALPTDPGILNQLVKRFISIPRMRRISKYDPRLIYALEHQNHISGLLELIKYVFQNDQLKIYYAPFRIHSWNLNLLCVAHIVKSDSE